MHLLPRPSGHAGLPTGLESLLSLLVCGNLPAWHLPCYSEGLQALQEGAGGELPLQKPAKLNQQNLSINVMGPWGREPHVIKNLGSRILFISLFTYNFRLNLMNVSNWYQQTI